jgi:hypothetical protein
VRLSLRTTFLCWNRNNLITCWHHLLKQKYPAVTRFFFVFICGFSGRHFDLHHIRHLVQPILLSDLLQRLSLFFAVLVIILHRFLDYIKPCKIDWFFHFVRDLRPASTIVGLGWIRNHEARNFTKLLWNVAKIFITSFRKFAKIKVWFCNIIAKFLEILHR